jgi:hypothetical protein
MNSGHDLAECLGIDSIVEARQPFMELLPELKPVNGGGRWPLPSPTRPHAHDALFRPPAGWL